MKVVCFSGYFWFFCSVHAARDLRCVGGSIKSICYGKHRPIEVFFEPSNGAATQPAGRYGPKATSMQQRFCITMLKKRENTY